MKILLVNKAYYPHIGGVETVVRQLATHMAICGHEARVLCFGERDDTEELEGVRLCRVAPAARIGSAPVGFGFIRRFSELSAWADVINIHSPNPMGELAALLYGTNKKIICTYHGDAQRPEFLLPGYDLLVRRFFGVCAAVAVSSPKLAASSRVLPSAGSKIIIIPIGIPVEKYKNTNKDDRKNAFTVMFAGRLVYYKGIFVLLEALLRLKNEGKNTSAFLIGSGPLEAKIKNFVIDNQLENCVTILPPQAPEIYRAMFGRADCFAFPSTHRTEAYGIALLEAMASALPVISTELGTGTSWINENGRTGLVIPPGDANALADAIKFLFLNTLAREKMGASAAERARELFDEKTMFKAYDDLFL
ncbi:lipopolysaccharide biosynthesis protein RfbV [Synergistales bacterium]|nr:lipopolysaccharide biosynthesis protein RfbV [Synergistales bacterium]